MIITACHLPNLPKKHFASGKMKAMPLVSTILYQAEFISNGQTGGILPVSGY
jgi:hypothetical protein